jgi:hypothetical protein
LTAYEARTGGIAKPDNQLAHESCHKRLANRTHEEPAGDAMPLILGGQKENEILPLFSSSNLVRELAAKSREI